MTNATNVVREGSIQKAVRGPRSKRSGPGASCGHGVGQGRGEARLRPQSQRKSVSRLGYTHNARVFFAGLCNIRCRDPTLLTHAGLQHAAGGHSLLAPLWGCSLAHASYCGAPLAPMTAPFCAKSLHSRYAADSAQAHGVQPLNLPTGGRVHCSHSHFQWIRR